MVYISGKKCSFTLLILSGSLSLAGCQTTPPPSRSTPSVEDVFTQDMQRVLIPQLLAANVQNLSGTLDLRIILNRASEPVACEARKSRHPSAIGSPRPQALSQLAVRQCWNMIYPKVPEAFFDADGTAEIHAPLFFSATEYPNDVGHQQRLQYAAQSQYFWDRVFASQPPNSIGVAGFRYQADADGKVEGCLVSLEPSGMRPDAFKFDAQLQQRLTGRCNALDLKQMPGFATDEAGVARGLVGVEYAPWKGRAH